MYIGLIGYNHGTIKNIKINNFKIRATDTTEEYSYQIYAGVLVGANSSAGVISNCHISNSEISVQKTFLKNDDNEYFYMVASG
jgi:hypothetical protein